MPNVGRVGSHESKKWIGKLLAIPPSLNQWGMRLSRSTSNFPPGSVSSRSSMASGSAYSGTELKNSGKVFGVRKEKEIVVEAHARELHLGPAPASLHHRGHDVLRK